MAKRTFDLALSLAGLLLSLPLLVALALLVKLDSPGPVLFAQRRVGRGFRPFTIYKFRTMVRGAEMRGGPLTCGDDLRVTRVGRILRAAKLDELPQLINILRGEMSFVGPRPEVPRYVDLYRAEYQELLTVRPGLTDFASLKYRDEAALLGGCADPHAEYVARILPDKLRLGQAYVRQASLWMDVRLIVETLRTLAR